MEDFKNLKRRHLIYPEVKHSQKTDDGIYVLGYEAFFKRLWARELL